MKNIIAITGVPGAGKTTLVKSLADKLQRRGFAVNGFFTEELRGSGKRVGFDVVTLDAGRGPLARIGTPGSKTPHMVGQYHVMLGEFESAVLPILDNLKTHGGGDHKRVCVIDEVGKMELFSKQFCDKVKTILTDRRTVLLVTIPVARGRPIPLVESIRTHDNTALFTVTRENRDGLCQEILAHIETLQQQTK